MKIALISIEPGIKAFGLRTLSSCLKQEGHNVKLIFLHNHFTNKYKEETLYELVELVRNSDVIGISLMTNFYDNAIQITKKLKHDLNTLVMWGGIHPTVRPDECISHADIVCLGEAEESFIELAHKLENGRDFLDTDGFWFKHGNKTVKNQIREAPKDLNKIPFQDYDYEHHYILVNGNIRKMDLGLLEDYGGKHLDYYSQSHYKNYMILTTRGCPFRCTYCYNNALNKIYNSSENNKIRKRSVDLIIEELLFVKNKLSFIEWISIGDDAFLFNNIEYISEFCRRYKREIGLPFYVGGVTPKTVDREKMTLLVDAGLIKIRMGIQTGSERMKKLYGRVHSNEQVIKSTWILNEFIGKMLPPNFDIILDNPWEKDEDLIETLMLLTKIPIPFSLNLFSLTFYPGIYLYEKAISDGIIKDDLNDVYRKHYKKGVKKHYLNMLFSLLHNYKSKGSSISTKSMALLTNTFIRKYKLHWILYFVYNLPCKTAYLKNLMKSAVRDIRNNNYDRIIGFIQRRIFRKA